MTRSSSLWHSRWLVSEWTKPINVNGLNIWKHRHVPMYQLGKLDGFFEQKHTDIWVLKNVVYIIPCCIHSSIAECRAVQPIIHCIGHLLMITIRSVYITPVRSYAFLETFEITFILAHQVLLESIPFCLQFISALVSTMIKVTLVTMPMTTAQKSQKISRVYP